VTGATERRKIAELVAAAFVEGASVVDLKRRWQQAVALTAAPLLTRTDDAFHHRSKLFPSMFSVHCTLYNPALFRELVQ